MSDHEHFEELAALSAAGLLSSSELAELSEHLQACSECRGAESDFAEIFRSGLPLTANPVGEFLRQRKVAANDLEMRDRFLVRARQQGVAFSPEVRSTVPRPAKFRPFVGAMATVAALLLVVFFGPGIYRRVTHPATVGTEQTVARLEQQNAALSQNISQLNQSLAARQDEIRKLQAQLGIAARTTEILREQNAQQRTEADRRVGQTVQLPAELANRDQQLQSAQNEIQRINKLHADDAASLAAQQLRIAELSDQLRVASATLDMERKLSAAGKDIRELLTARQLHVIDVRDVQANGKPGKAFGRIFLTEGKSLTFYAFDLSEDRGSDAKRRYELWGSQLAKGSPPQRLGFFYVDDKAQRRWALNVSDPKLIQEVGSVFVTLESAANSATPTGQPLLYANLRTANRP